MFDSGSGGFSVWQAITDVLPKESVIYIGDHRCIPYSTKTRKEIRIRACKLIEFLLTKQVKLIVVACNTATIAGITYYRKKYPQIPIIGVVPVVKTAAEISKTRKFAVFSTVSTAKSSYQKKLISQFAGDCTVYSIGNSTMIELIEKGKHETEEMTAILQRILSPVIKKKIDVLVLGCTHFPFVIPCIKKIIGNLITILDSGHAVARHVKRILEANKTMVCQKDKAMYHFYTTGESDHVSAVASLLVGRPVVVEPVDIP